MSSLEDLLVEEGFNRRKLRMSLRKSLGPESKNMQLVVPNVGPRRPGSVGSSSTIRRATRTRSDVAHYHSRAENVIDKIKGTKPINSSFTRGRGLQIEQGKIHERKGSRESMKAKKVAVVSAEESSGFEAKETAESDEIIEVGLHENKKYNETFKNDGYSNDDSEAQDDARFQENGSYKPPPEKEILFDRKYSIISDENLPMDTSMNSYKKINTKQAAEDKKIRRHAEIGQDVDTPALDEAAILTLISMLTSYAKRFLTDEDFRASLRLGSFESLNFSGHEHALISESKAIKNLQNAIKLVERAAEESADSRELKKASLQLSVITGLNSNDMKDGYTSGIPNYKLSACAHVYLSVIFVLQKKDKVAAKHLLQVLCDSPLQARTVLLADLWDQIFVPHFTELNGWYSKATESLANSSGNARKLKLLEKVYNEVLDSCTFQIASYYKDWLTEGVPAPLLPSIQIPSSIPFEIVEDEDQGDHSHEISSPSHTSPSLPITRRKLDSEQVSEHSTKTGSAVVECEEESFDISGRSSHFATLEGNSSSETVKKAITDVKYDVSSHPEVEETERSILTTSSQKLSSRDLLHSWIKKQETLGHMRTVQSPLPSQVSEMILKILAKEVFEQQHSNNSLDSAHRGVFLLPDSGLQKTKSGSPGDESGSCGCVNGESFFSGIPSDFVCPLLQLPFDDPVTLETGNTFERSAITKWFNRDNRTCPVTKKTLECQSVPQSNSILKRVIDNWRSEYYKSLMDLASKLKDCAESKDEIAVFIIEQLLMASSEEERKRNAMQIVNGGGLQFLVHRFHIGNIEEKTRISAILLTCIQVDAACRTYICVNIERVSLLYLLHSEQLKSRTSAVSLLTEIVCLNRRKDAMHFLQGLQREEILSAMHVLLMLLQSCEEERKPQIAVLLLHFDLLGEPQNYSLYRGEAVDAITVALESSLEDEAVRENCCRALLVLGGHFSSSGKIMTEDWILKQAGFLHYQVYFSPEHEESRESMHNSAVTTEQVEDLDEDRAREKWLLNLSASLLGDGDKSFLEAISACLMSQFPDLVRVCITTVAWLSSAIVSLSDAEFQLAAFSALLAGLKICLEHGEHVEHRVLASMSLLNFSKFPECRLLLMTMDEDIALSLESLAEVTWTAKELYDTICS